MSLIVVLTNDGTGTNEASQYDARVLINDQLLWFGKVKNHDRKLGWIALVEQLCDLASIDYNYAPLYHTPPNG